MIKKRSKNEQKSKKKLIKISLDADVVFCCFFKGFLTKFSEFPKRANLENQAKTMEGWSKMHFPMLRLGSNVDNRIIEFQDIFLIEKQEDLKNICIKSEKKARSTKERFSRLIFDDFGVIFCSFLRQNGVKKPKKTVTIFEVKKGIGKMTKSRSQEPMTDSDPRVGLAPGLPRG